MNILIQPMKGLDKNGDAGTKPMHTVLKKQPQQQQQQQQIVDAMYPLTIKQSNRTSTIYRFITCPLKTPFESSCIEDFPAMIVTKYLPNGMAVGSRWFSRWHPSGDQR